jgi:NAD(P)-dependent dehydrogenase (short-subunit alcohol dehydrogenase family)
MPWTVSDIPPLTGKVAVVTGANGGLGLETAKALAGAGAHVIMAVRDQAKAASAIEEIRAVHPDASLELVSLDLGSQSSIRAAAATILDTHFTIDILVNNAGLMALPESRTVDGFETQLGVNHLGHWTLTALLLPAILHATAGRVVTVSSMARYQGRRLDPTNVHLQGVYDPWRAYGNSKLANYHFALGLQREFKRRGATTRSLVAHPGLSHTDLQVRTDASGGAGKSGARWRAIAARWGMPPERGALPQLRAATDPRAKGSQMYAPRLMASGVPVRRPTLRPGRRKAIMTLWEVSERETGVPIGAKVPRSPR